MTDLLKGLTGSGWASLFAWILPCAGGLALFWYFAIPELASATFVASLKSDGTLVPLFVGASTLLGVLLSAASTPLYRILEGYFLWPRSLQSSRKGAYQKKKEALKGQVGGGGWERGLALEKLARYPVDDEQVAPTRLGNAIRAFEMYGSDRFGLDSGTMWSELSALIPKSLQLELDRSRALVDFFVATFYVAALIGSLALAGWLWHPNSTGLLILAILSFFSAPISYELAIVGTTYWRSTVQALVNTGRIKLAEQMGLELPLSLDAEREMWGYLTQFVYCGDSESGRKLDAYRKRQEGTARAAVPESESDQDD